MEKVKMLSVKDVADTLDISENTVRRWITEGKIKGLKFGRQWRFKPSDLSAWLEHGDQAYAIVAQAASSSLSALTMPISAKAQDLILEVVIEPDEDVYHAYCPILDGCHSSGDTVAEAFNNIQEAVRLHLEVMIEDGEAIPGIGIVDSINRLNLVFKVIKPATVAAK